MGHALANVLEGAVIALVVALIAWSVYSVAREYAPTPLDTSNCEVAQEEPVRITICPYRENTQ